MSFKRWLARAEETDDPEGDLIQDMKSDGELPEFKSLGEMQEYLRASGACGGALEAADEVWKQYLKPEPMRKPVVRRL